MKTGVTGARETKRAVQRRDASERAPAPSQTLALGRAARHFLHLALLGAARVFTGLFGRLLLACGALGLLAFFLAQCFGICHVPILIKDKLRNRYARSRCAYFSTSFFNPNRGNCTVILAFS